jgi:YhfC intramembrane metalloprotease
MSVLWPSSSCPVRRSTLAITRRLAKVWRRSCQRKFEIPARLTAGRKTRFKKFCASRGVSPVSLGKTPSARVPRRHRLRRGPRRGRVGALGLGAAGTFVFMVLRRGAEAGDGGLPGGQAEHLARIVAGYWAVPPWLPLLGGVERAFGILVHLSTSVLVMLCFVRGALWPLLAAIGWHAFVDGTVVYSAWRFGLPATEAAVAAFGVASLFIIRWVRPALDGGEGTPPARDY